MSDLYHLVRRLREEGLSRNRDFEALSVPLARRARRIDRWLRGLERDLRASDAIAVEKSPAGIRIRLERRAVRICREVTLTVEEYDLLARDPITAALLSATPPSND